MSGLSRLQLPFLPGFSFAEPNETKFNCPQTLTYKSGCAIAVPNQVVSPLEHLQLESHLGEGKVHYLTYGKQKKAPSNHQSSTLPNFIKFDKKVLKFDAYFKENIQNSMLEEYRIRHVNIYYYLIDDTMSISEPVIENSGIPQGKLVIRQKVPKNNEGEFFSWKDLNIEEDITIYGRTYHIVDCDKWSREYLVSQGIHVPSSKQLPADPYFKKRQKDFKQHNFTTSSTEDKLWKLLNLDRQVLRFYCVWEDQDKIVSELRSFILQFYLVDDTMEIREVHKLNDGRDPYPLFLHRHKVPKDRSNVSSLFPIASTEPSETETENWFKDSDFAVGKTIQIYGRNFLLYDCDEFTKNYYKSKFGVEDFHPIEIKTEPVTLKKIETPPYNGFGSMEDSLQSCFSLVPHPPKKNIVKMLQNDGKVLRFEAVLNSVWPIDQSRKFIISYHLADDTISIYERPIRNSGLQGGKFLRRMQIAKPNSNPNSPEYYSIQDFKLGAPVIAAGRQFIITKADDLTLKYLEEHEQKFKVNGEYSDGQTQKRDIQCGPDEATSL
ncbi:EF-hand domain-containing protein 1-like isoform X1 [Tachypleus tridentatus]|uniref:EF-hand domain-containing protein 1-like isoform X1 n=1 Tax=Tachypleus tridentatus TaxID=6853 RepID=UPI003FD08641